MASRERRRRAACGCFYYYGERRARGKSTMFTIKDQREVAGAKTMASEERIKIATRYRKSRLCGKMPLLTEAATGGMRRAARGCWSQDSGAKTKASEERIKTATRYRKSRRCGKMPLLTVAPIRGI